MLSQEKSLGTFPTGREKALSGMSLTRKGGQWAEKREQSSKPFQDRSNSSLFWLEQTLSSPPCLSHLGSHTTLRLWREKQGKLTEPKDLLLSAEQQLARRPGGAAVPLKGARACQRLFVEPPGADVLAPGLRRVGRKGQDRTVPGTNRNAVAKRRTPRAHSLAWHTSGASPSTSNSQGHL